MTSLQALGAQVAARLKERSQTIAVADAPAALQLLQKQACDLVLLDVELPDVDGLALCRLLRAQPALRQLPLVVFSANDSEGRKVEAFTAGADDYIVKPFDVPTCSTPSAVR